MAMGVKRGDHVITQAFNFIATVEAILDCGAIPIIVNVDKTLNMDVEELKEKNYQKNQSCYSRSYVRSCSQYSGDYKNL